MSEIIKGMTGPAEMLAGIEDRAALKGQYIRHRDSGEIYKILEVGREGVTAFKADGFGGPVSHTEEYLITWSSLQYKHVIMVHVSDINVKSENVQ